MCQNVKMNSRKLKMVSNQILELFFFASFKVLALESISSSNLETQAVLLIFSLELEISGVAVLHQNSENGGFCEKLLSENDFEAVSATFCCFDCGANASEAVQKIATDQKEYHKCSCVL